MKHMLLFFIKHPCDDLTEDMLAKAMNTDMATLLESLQKKVDGFLAEIKSHDPLPIFKESEAASFVEAMKPKFKKLAIIVNGLEGVLEQARVESSSMRMDPKLLLPSMDVATSEVKRVLTACCVNTAARILTSKAAANASGSLSQSVQSTLDFAKANGLTLPKEIIVSLRACQDRLAEAAAAAGSKQQQVAKPKP